MPWHVSKGHSGCPPSRPYAVVKNSDGSVEACHPTRAKADDHMRALYANEPKAGSDMTAALDVQTGGKPNPGTGKDRRLADNGTPCPKGQTRDADGNCVEAAAETVAAAWDPSGYTDAEYQRAAAACGPASAGSVQERCILPHHTKSGGLDRSGLAAAASRYGQSKAAPAVRARAASHLRGHYREIGEPVPDSLKSSVEELLALAADLTPPVDASTSDAAPDWRGVLLVEGKPTGDQREFAAGATEWPDTAAVTVPLQWQMESSHGGTSDKVVSVGRIDRIWREGNNVMGEGRFDSHPDAAEAQRRVKDGFLNGVSILADDITDADVEYVMDGGDSIADETGEGPDLLEMLFARPELTRYHKARVRAATLVDVPAFVESTVTYIGDSGAAPSPVPVGASVSRAAVAVHEAELSGAEWDPAVQEARLPREMPGEVARGAYGYAQPSDDGTVSRAACRFLHHEISEAGTPGAANLAACRAGLDALSSVQLPDNDRQAVWEHLAAHLLAAGETVPHWRTALVAAAGWASDKYLRRREWFTDPKLTVETPIMVSDAGRVWGLATTWKQCHIGFRDRCILPPKEAWHAYYMTGQVPTDSGETIAVGPITADRNHAPTEGISWHRAKEHYENTSWIVADAAVGNCDLGIWVAGQVRPNADPDRVDALRSTGQVSPDWREIGGELRLVALLAVPASGYQVAQQRPTIRAAFSGDRVTAVIASGMVSVPTPATYAERAQRRELELHRAQLRQRITT